MRATEYLFIVGMIGVFVYLIISGATNLNQIYPDNPINTTNFTGNYNQIDDIQNTTTNMYENFQKLGREDTSWFQKIGAGIVAIPYAVINFPILVVKGTGAIFSMMAQALGGVFPAIILSVAVLFITIEVVKRFLEFFQRSRS